MENDASDIKHILQLTHFLDSLGNDSAELGILNECLRELLDGLQVNTFVWLHE